MNVCICRQSHKYDVSMYVCVCMNVYVCICRQSHKYDVSMYVFALLEAILEHDSVHDVPVIIFANKQDIPVSEFIVRSVLHCCLVIPCLLSMLRVR